MASSAAREPLLQPTGPSEAPAPVVESLTIQPIDTSSTGSVEVHFDAAATTAASSNPTAATPSTAPAASMPADLASAIKTTVDEVKGVITQNLMDQVRLGSETTAVAIPVTGPAPAVVSAASSPAPAAAPTTQATTTATAADPDAEEKDFEVPHYDPLDGDATAKPEMNTRIYKVVKGLAYLSFLLEGLYELFTYKYTKEALELVGTQMFGANAEIMSKVAIAPAAVLTALDAGANLTLFDPEDEAKAWAKNLSEGFCVGTFRYLKRAFGSCNGFLTVGIPTLGMLISFPVGSYADIEPINGFLTNTFGPGKWVAVGLITAIGSAYYVISQAGDCLNGVDFYLNRGEAKLNPEQKSLARHLRDGRLASVFQCLIEQLSSTVSRSISFAFLAGRLGEQNDLNSTEVHALQAAGFLAATIAFAPARQPASYRKYFGTKGNRLDLVTKAERDQVYAAQYGRMSWKTYIFNELKRMLSPIAISESALVGYFGSQIPDATMSHIDALDGWPIKYALPIACGIILGAAAYLGIYRRASLELELNTAALKTDAVRTRIQRLEGAAEKKEKDVEAQTLVPVATPDSKPARGITTTASLFAFGTFAARTLCSIPSTIGVMGNHTRMSKQDQMVFSATANTVVAGNGYDYYRGKIVGALTSWFSRCRPNRNSSGVVNPTGASINDDAAVSSSASGVVHSSPHTESEATTPMLKAERKVNP